MIARQTIKRQAGFTLIEAMVALLIFSAGLLGLAGMQMSGMQNNHSAILHTLAVQQTYDMAERIRANQAGATAEDYDAMNSDTVLCTTDCTAAQIDFADWYTTTQDVLPSGSGEITGKAVDNNGDTVPDSRSYTITVSWVEPSGLNASVDLTFQP